MPHRTVDVDGIQIEAFNTRLGAQHWIKKHEGDCIVVARGAFYFQRKAGSEMTVHLNAKGDAKTSHIFSAANTIAGLVERELDKVAA